MYKCIYYDIRLLRLAAACYLIPFSLINSFLLAGKILATDIKGEIVPGQCIMLFLTKKNPITRNYFPHNWDTLFYVRIISLQYCHDLRLPPFQE